MRRALVVLVVTAGALVGMAAPAHAPEERRYLPCAMEDSPGPCYWDAQVMGNGLGRSFLREYDGSVIYTD